MDVVCGDKLGIGGRCIASGRRVSVERIWSWGRVERRNDIPFRKLCTFGFSSPFRNLSGFMRLVFMINRAEKNFAKLDISSSQDIQFGHKYRCRHVCLRLIDVSAIANHI